MSRWVRGAIWAAGSCVVWCPMCVCLSGGGAWWVCACAVGLITVTLGSGYTTWTVFNNLIQHGPHSYPVFAQCFSILERVVDRGQTSSCPNLDGGKHSKVSQTKIEFGGSGSGGSELVMQEMAATASSLHSFLVLPWYTRVSPDTHHSYQIKDVLEEMLGNMCRRVQESGSITHMTASILQIYLQHYRQYQRAVKKVSKKHKDFELFSKIGLEELQAKYKPLHPALKSQESLKLYYRKLAQALLLHYLPVEVTRCDLILISLRDLFAQNVLQAFVDLLCDTQWLNTTLTEILSGGMEDVQNRDGQNKRSSPKEENIKIPKSLEGLTSTPQVISDERALHTSLPSIEEETLSELQQLNPTGAQSAQLTEDSSDSVNNKDDEKKFENAKELVEYVRSSSLEKKESSEEEDYKTVSSALGTLISTTAGPLLPDSSSPPYEPLVSKMWESPVEDKCFIDIPPVKKKKNPFSRNVVEGMKEEDYKMLCCSTTTSDKNVKEASSPASIAENSLVPKISEISQKGSIEIKIEDSEATNKGPDGKTLVPNLRDIPRSKSCGNLIDNGEESETLGVETKTLHSSLGELDHVEAKESKDIEKEESVETNDDVANRKEKGHLVKMLSFDKNDGIDEVSLENEKVASKECESEKADQGERLKVLQAKDNASPVSTSPDQNQSPHTASTVTPTKESDPPGTLEIPDSPPLGNAGFGWENPDLSPIYEESEDLASSIAKLRSLLSERESQHSLGSLSSYGSSESEPKSAQSDPGRYNLEKSRFTFTHKDSSGSLAASVKSVSSLESCGNGIADEELLEAAEIPLDGRVFLSVCVPSTEVHTEPGGTQYTLYTIQYDAIYLCETPTITEEGGEEGSSDPPPVSEPRMVLQTNCVKRRFREFHTLHDALEGDTKLRAAMKGVKGPNKWLNLPFSKLDSATIATRKQFLEKYLQSVIQRPEVNISTPVKEFLAYGSDASVSFVKKPLELHVPRLDKLLAKTVSGVFHSLKTALPSFESSDSQSGSSEGAGSNSGGLGSGSGGDVMLRSRSGGGILSERNKLAAFLSSGTKGEYELKLDITAEEEDCQIEASLIMEVSGAHHDELVESAYEAKETRTETQFLSDRLHHHSVVVGCCDVGRRDQLFHMPPYLPPPGPRPRGDGCDDDDDALSRRSSNQDSVNGEDGRTSWENWPLSVSMLDVMVELLAPCDHPITRQPCVTLLTRTFAKIAHKWLQTELEHLFNENNTVEYIQTLRETLLASIEAQTPPPPSFEEVMESREKLKGALKDFIPGVVQVLLGREVTQLAAMRVVDSLQHPAVMTDLGLHLLDLMAAQLLPIPPDTP
uniref:PX domain-containing protein n=1 Tax=Scylla olivacea TaxID=85551 RepID=A0A0P4WIV1_SCYOL